MNIEAYYQSSLQLLKQLISTKSMSGEEDETAQIILEHLQSNGIQPKRKGNNIYAFNEHYDPSKETILLNSHHDTVKPNSGYTLDPYTPIEKDGKLFGLGSNDAGGCLVSLINTFIHFYQEALPFNLTLACTAEEENSGRNGVESILEELGTLTYGIVGEPTEMHMAVAEKGLMVLDGVAKGVAGHAARDIGENAIYKAIEDISLLKSLQFPNVSKTLGPIKVSVTQVEAGYQHNVIPDQCKFVVDVRTTDAHTNEEVLEMIQQQVASDIKARSIRLRPSFMPEDTPVFRAAKTLGVQHFGSATTSDQALIPVPTIKMGPGQSERSHTPDEFIWLDELKQGVQGYIQLIDQLKIEYEKS